MQSPMPIAVAEAQLAQAMRDYTAAHDAAMATPPIDDKLAASTILQSLRYVEQHGLTDKGRRELRLAIGAAKTIMGLEQ
jgi:hypothetical protein